MGDGRWMSRGVRENVEREPIGCSYIIRGYRGVGRLRSTRLSSEQEER